MDTRENEAYILTMNATRTEREEQMEGRYVVRTRVLGGYSHVIDTTTGRSVRMGTMDRMIAAAEDLNVRVSK